MNPRMLAAIMTVLMILFGIFLPINRLIPYPANLIGLFLILSGTYIGMEAIILFRKNRTPLDPEQPPTRLVMARVFTFTRNPMYLGLTIIMAGLSIILGSISAFIFPILFILGANFFIVPKEETRMEILFGTEYTDYKNEVRRWL